MSEPETQHEVVLVHYPSCAAETFGPFQSKQAAERWAVRQPDIMSGRGLAGWRVQPCPSPQPPHRIPQE
jgi:hypothetical protein